MSYRFSLWTIKAIILKTKCKLIVIIQFLLISYDTRFSLRIMKNRVVWNSLRIHKKKDHVTAAMPQTICTQMIKFDDIVNLKNKYGFNTDTVFVQKTDIKKKFVNIW